MFLTFFISIRLKIYPQIYREEYYEKLQIMDLFAFSRAFPKFN
jgi:hypothetical protein